jgi:hypothetical protein
MEPHTRLNVDLAEGMREHIVKLTGDPHPLGLHLGLLAFGDPAGDLRILLPARSHALPHTEHDENSESHGRDSRG